MPIGSPHVDSVRHSNGGKPRLPPTFYKCRQCWITKCRCIPVVASQVCNRCTLRGLPCSEMIRNPTNKRQAISQKSRANDTDITSLAKRPHATAFPSTSDVSSHRSVASIPSDVDNNQNDFDSPSPCDSSAGTELTSETDTSENHSKILAYHIITAAAINGSFRIVQRLIELGADINVQDPDGVNSLWLAASEGHSEICSLLLENNSVIDCRHNETGKEVLHHAAQKGLSSIVKILIAQGAKVDCKDKDHETPLLLAASDGHLEIVELLIDARAAINSPEKKFGRTPLHKAAKNGHEAIVNALLDAGADPNCPSECNITPLCLAAYKGHAGVVRILLEELQYTETELLDTLEEPLHYAVRGGHVEVVRTLLNAGAEVDCVIFDGITPLMLAVVSDHRGVIKLLLDKQAQVNRKMSGTLRQPLHLAALEGHRDVIEQLLQAHAPVDAEDSLGRTPLFLAAEFGSIRAVTLLLQADANINAVDRLRRQQAIHRAARGGNYYVLEALIAAGADINAKDAHDETPLMFAASRESPDCLYLLLIKGAKVNDVSTKGWTALTYASASDSLKCFEALFRHDAAFAKLATARLPRVEM